MPMTSRIGFPHQHVQNPDVRANIAIYSNSELRYLCLGFAKTVTTTTISNTNATNTTTTTTTTTTISNTNATNTTTTTTTISNTNATNTTTHFAPCGLRGCKN